MSSQNCSVTIDRSLLDGMQQKPSDPESPARKHTADARSFRRRKSMIKSRDMIDHDNKADIMNVYIKHKKLSPGKCMKKTVAEITGTSADDVTLEDYNNYRNRIYYWLINDEKLAEDGIKPNELKRKICYASKNEKRRILNTASRVIIKSKLQDNRHKFQVTAKRQTKAMTDERVQAQLAIAIENGDIADAQRLLGFQNSDTMKD